METRLEEFQTQKPNGITRDVLANMANGFLTDIGEDIVPLDQLIGVAANFCTAIDMAQKNKSIVDFARLGKELATNVVGSGDHNAVAYETIARLWVSLLLGDKMDLEQAHQASLDFYRKKLAAHGQLREERSNNSINGNHKPAEMETKPVGDRWREECKDIDARAKLRMTENKPAPASIGFRAVLMAAIADHEAKAKSLREFLGKIGPADDSALSEIFRNLIKGE